jgi:cell fate regulator YaaT (PSP1 superfamily)
MIRLVPIKFRAAGRHYDFNALDFELRAGDRVVVETDRGRALGTVVEPPREVPSAAPRMSGHRAASHR